MRPLSETATRWQETMKHGGSLGDLQRAVKFNGPSSPCVSGLRSVCWKAFLLSKDLPKDSDAASPDDWIRVLKNTRASYEKARQEKLRFLKHPEQLTALSLDPLADDPDSPWDELRRDEAVRAEMAQDVRRLPDVPFYHEDRVQTMILDVLFLYCKLHPGAGGYRQGMHELLAPILYVVHQDAVDEPEGLPDAGMLDMLDADFVEHDAYALFCSVMEPAGRFYDVRRTEDGEHSAIVDKSEHIHDHILMSIDPELAGHLKHVDVLPQIFLIRWIRLLFGREFPFEQLLVLWDTMFAFDPHLELIDLICAAMLVRIRWTLLDADHSGALQVLLKYPGPQPPHGPHTFVDDALYLKDHVNAAGGAALIMKYTGKTPTAPTIAASSNSSSSRPATPTPTALQGLARQRILGARSPLSASARLLQHPGGVEALFTGAAKGVMERGEKLGINQAVREAVGEIRRNMQGAGVISPDPSAAALVAVHRRNRQLAALLDESITGLKALAPGNPQADAIELAAARIQLVKVYLEDATLTLPDNDDDVPAVGALSLSSPGRPLATVAVDTTPVVVTSSAVDVATTSLSPPLTAGGEERMDTDTDTDVDGGAAMRAQTGSPPTTTPIPTASPPQAPAAETPAAPPPPPPPSARSSASAPIPTRSTLAQSSFAWMLDDPDTALSSTTRVRGGGRRSGAQGGKAVGRSRDRNAFLFGEVTTDVDVDGSGNGNGAGDMHVDVDVQGRKLSVDQIFGLRPMRKTKSVAGWKAP